MIEFKILKKSKRSRARLGILKTPHGEVLTPTLVPVGTQAVIKTLDSEEIKQTKTQIIISNTFHLHLKPGEQFIKIAGGIHKFSKIPVPIMTDSGGFQVFSLGFGHDLQVGKLLKMFPEGQTVREIDKGAKPKFLKITESGVHFRSPIDGRQIFIGPKESIKIQEEIGADIIFAFDECTSPTSSRGYIEQSLERTHRWAKICRDAHKTKSALFGIVQGSRFKDLREHSAKFINSLGFSGYGIGGDLGDSKKSMWEILSWVTPHLDENKPRHLLGIGYLEDMEMSVKSGMDLFDCTAPTHFARRGIAFVSSGRLNLNRSVFLKDKKPLDKSCECFVCENYTRNYICHLMKAKEITGMKLLTFHNLFYFNTFVEKIREKIKKGLL